MRINLIKRIRIIFWMLALFSYYFQCPFTFLSKLIIPSVFAFILLESFNFRIRQYNFKGIVYFYIFFLSTSMILSILKGTDISRVLRFYMILLAIPICFTIRDNDFIEEEKIFIIMAMMKSLMLVGVAVVLLCTKNYVPFRNWAKTYGHGDIYILQGVPKVQVKGNALLIVAFMLDYMKRKKITWMNIILLLGILAAGNFAFILGIAAFVLYRMGTVLFSAKGRNNCKKAVLIFGSVCGLILMLPYINNQRILKSAQSNRVRIEQAKIFLDTNLLLGEGLGNVVVSDNEYIGARSGGIYFELQTLYIFNQIGLLGIIPFYIITLWAAYKNGKEKLWIYLLYLFYSFWNPYCFDTTQMLAIIAILNFKEKHGKSKRHSNSLLSVPRCAWANEQNCSAGRQVIYM